MKTATHSERERFVALMIRNCPTATASTCQRLLRLGGSYGRIQVSKRAAKALGTPANGLLEREARIEHKIANLCREIRAMAIFCSPSNGFTVNILKGSGRFPVPTS